MRHLTVVSIRPWMASVVLAVACCAAGPVLDARRDSSLDKAFAAYAGGDHGAVARTFVAPQDFQPLELTKPQVFDEWLGSWQPIKAAFVIELARAANLVAPAKTWPIIAAGRRYVTKRPTRPGASESEDAFERLWHRTALGVLQRHLLATFQEQYLEAVRPRTSEPSLADDRLQLAAAIAQEQRCWNDRPDLDRAGAAADAVPLAAGQTVTTNRNISKSQLAEQRERQRICLTDAVTRFDAAASGHDSAAEARVRAAWLRFQLGQHQEALRTIEGVDPGDDKELAYWAGLFRGRIATALGRHADAERAYRGALAAFPDAQSAGVGLALTLFKMDRDVDADTVALAVRTRTAAVDPWWAYMSADQRFVERWTNVLRGSRQ